jgi:mono/diheme cytochrome c family protein
MTTRALTTAAFLLPFASSATLATGQNADRGTTVFAAQKCSLCHSLDGKGNAKGALDEVGSKLTADQIRQWIVNPVDMAAKAQAARKPPMKAYANLPKDDLDALVGMLAARKKK